MDIDDIKIIRNKIREKNHSWIAGSTAVSRLPREEWRRHLGLIGTEEELKANAMAIEAEDALAAAKGIFYVFPTQWDWRNVSGKDWTTPIRDQSGCGACVAFAVVAAVESSLEIFKRNPYLNIDLSEADLFFGGCGNCCAAGWTFVPAMTRAKSKGIPDEACRPYNRGDGSSTCPDRDKRIVKIVEWRQIGSASQAKEWLSKRGPLVTGFQVYEDFFYYSGGIYKSTYGGYVGLHAICIVGYNDAGGYWICKNSWGTEWGENGWFRMAYGECGIGGLYPFYAVEFTTTDDIILNKSGRVIVRFKSKETSLKHEVRLYSPQDKLIFETTDANLGKVFDLGSMRSGDRLVLALKTSDGHVYYTDSTLNADACDHVKKVDLGTYKWELRWEDLYGLGEQDYNDVVMEVEILDPNTSEIVMPKDGKVLLKFKSKSTDKANEFHLLAPESRLLFKAEDANIGKTFDAGLFLLGTKLDFALKTSDGRTYTNDNAQNPDSAVHVKKVPSGYNKWELRWEDTYNLKDKDYNDLIVEMEVVPVENDDIVLTDDGLVTVKFSTRNTPFDNEIRLHSPDQKAIFVATTANLKKSYDIGRYKKGDRLVFALKTPEGKVYYTDSRLNPDSRDHVFKLQMGSNRWMLRWEDTYNLKDKDYNDVVMEVSVKK